MQAAVNSLAVLAFLGVVVLLFANSALLRIVRELQAAMAQVNTASAVNTGDQSHRQVDAFAREDGRTVFAMVVDSSCPACHERSARYGKLADEPAHHFVAVSADPDCAEWFTGTEVEAFIDADLLGHIGVSVTPTLIRYDDTGREQWRRVVASDADLERLLREGT